MLALVELDLLNGEKILLNLSHLVSIKTTINGNTELKFNNGDEWVIKQSVNEIKYMLAPRPQPMSAFNPANF